MSKLSPRYRNDSSEGIDPHLRNYLDSNYFAKLANIEESNPKLLVVFAGGNAVGKSTLSERISEELKGLRLENDGVKRVLLKAYPELAMTDKLHNLTWQYTMDLYKRLDDLSPNGLIVRDGIITWYFDRILPIFIERGYKIFVVGYDLSDDKMAELIDSRGDTPTSTAKRFRGLIADQKIHLKRFFEHYNADIMLKDATIFDHDGVIASIRRKITQELQ